MDSEPTPHESVRHRDSGRCFAEFTGRVLVACPACGARLVMPLPGIATPRYYSELLLQPAALHVPVAVASLTGRPGSGTEAWSALCEVDVRAPADLDEGGGVSQRGTGRPGHLQSSCSTLGPDRPFRCCPRTRRMSAPPWQRLFRGSSY